MATDSEVAKDVKISSPNEVQKKGNSKGLTSEMAVAVESLKKQGFLKKRTGRLFKKFVPYWFELDPITDTLLYYLSQRTSSDPPSNLAGHLRLEGCKIESKDSDLRILIRTKRGKSHVLLANEKQDHQDWKMALSEVRNFAKSTQDVIAEFKQDDSTEEFITATGAHDRSPPVEEDFHLQKEIALPETNIEEIKRNRLKTLMGFQVEDISGSKMTLKEALMNQPLTIVVLLRHLGCILCRQLVQRLTDISQQLLALGVPIVGICQESPNSLKTALKDLKFPGKIYCDTQKNIYIFLNCKHGARYVINTTTLNCVREAYHNGNRQGELSADVNQIGGTFVLSLNFGVIHYHIDKFAGDRPNTDMVLRSAEEYLLSNPFEAWSNQIDRRPNWSEVLKPNSPPNPLMFTSNNQWNVENGALPLFVKPDAPLVVEDSHYNTQYYKLHLAEKPHWNFWGELDEKPEDEKLAKPSPASSAPSINAFILSIEKPTSGNDAKAILRTRDGDERFFVPERFCYQEKDALQYVKALIPYISNTKFRKFKDKEEIETKLLAFEDKSLIKKYKFGILYATEGQTEKQMYNNANGSPQFVEFLNFLGEKICLNGWEGYTGGLDAKHDRTGEESYFTTFDEYQIMFHVSTLLPFKPVEEGDTTTTQIERKKHLGNDVVIIIFKEGNTPIDISLFRSQYNHVFVVVSVHPSSTPEQTWYQIAFGSKPGVKAFGPFLPTPAIFQRSPEFRNFFMTKLINGERAAIHGPLFENRPRTRQVAMNDIIQNNPWKNVSSGGSSATVSRAASFRAPREKSMIHSASDDSTEEVKEEKEKTEEEMKREAIINPPHIVPSRPTSVLWQKPSENNSSPQVLNAPEDETPKSEN
eukprot:TRINITY_DN7021_c0_g3_i2.p1 TRINITY_DN7021_c0_g3~~TRINITY_DN7021_c0_g3_i2.p1  ORF type:complete len:869 (+),score=227.28 TRINITY_DN7021_c0_g3_i2:208-2814(+)